MRLGAQRNGKPGQGVRRDGMVQHVCRFDDEMFYRVLAKATRDGTSLSEAIRTLVEWGLEQEEASDA